MAPSPDKRTTYAPNNPNDDDHPNNANHNNDWGLQRVTSRVQSCTDGSAEAVLAAPPPMPRPMSMPSNNQNHSHGHGGHGVSSSSPSSTPPSSSSPGRLAYAMRKVFSREESERNQWHHEREAVDLVRSDSMNEHEQRQRRSRSGGLAVSRVTSHVSAMHDYGDDHDDAGEGAELVLDEADLDCYDDDCDVDEGYEYEPKRPKKNDGKQNKAASLRKSKNAAKEMAKANVCEEANSKQLKRGYRLRKFLSAPNTTRKNQKSIAMRRTPSYEPEVYDVYGEAEFGGDDERLCETVSPLYNIDSHGSSKFSALRRKSKSTSKQKKHQIPKGLKNEESNDDDGDMSTIAESVDLDSSISSESQFGKGHKRRSKSKRATIALFFLLAAGGAFVAVYMLVGKNSWFAGGGEKEVSALNSNQLEYTDPDLVGSSSDVEVESDDEGDATSTDEANDATNTNNDEDIFWAAGDGNIHDVESQTEQVQGKPSHNNGADSGKHQKPGPKKESGKSHDENVGSQEGWHHQSSEEAKPDNNSQIASSPNDAPELPTPAAIMPPLSTPVIVNSNAPSTPPTANPSETPTTENPTDQPSKNPTTTTPTTTTPTTTPTIDTYTKFYLMADCPYDDNERENLMPQHISDLPADGEFLVHLGDLQYAKVDECQEYAYKEASAILRKSPVPTFVLPGDNDINDCDDHEHGETMWKKYFKKMDARYWDHDFDLTRWGDLDESFSFLHKQVLYFGLNIVGGSPYSKSEKKERHKEHLEYIQWILKKLDEEDFKVMVLFGHAEPGEHHDDFFWGSDGWASIVEEVGKPTIHFHGDAHVYYEVEEEYDLDNYMRISLDGESVAPPIMVEIDVSRTNPIRVSRRRRDLDVDCCRYGWPRRDEL